MADTNDYDQEKAFQEEIKKVPEESIKDKLIKIKGLVVKRINLEKDFRVEQCKLEAKYESLYAPLYKERSDIINGKVIVNAEEVKSVLPEVKIDSTESKETGVPEYWLTCLKNTSQFGDMITPKDEKVLKYLTDLTIDYNENGNFTLSFSFSPNEFFSHEKLKRDFIMDDKQNIKKIESTSIEWTSEEVNPTIAKKKKKVKQKGKSDVKTIIKVEECESFFNFFKNYNAEDKGKETKKENNDDEDEEVDHNLYIEEEYDLGVFIKDELIPYSLEYYLDIVEDEEEDEGDEDEENDGGDEDDEDEKPKKKLF